MYCSKSLSFALFLAAASASPTVDRASRVRRDDPPAPSSFPLGTACNNEWQYVNFDPEDDTDKGRLQKAHDIICGGELRALASYGQESAQDSLAPYKRYFPDNDDEDDYQDRVASVLGLIAGDDSAGEGTGEVVGGMVVDNNDFKDICSDGVTGGYTDTDDADDREKIHFCDLAWAKGSAGDVDCGSLDPFPSTKMDSFSRVALHEMTHYSTVGPVSELQGQITDQLNDDGEKAYDPPRVHGLLDPDQDDQLDKCEGNADSYAWMSLDSWISRTCAEDNTGNNWQTFFTEDPPNY